MIFLYIFSIYVHIVQVTGVGHLRLFSTLLKNVWIDIVPNLSDFQPETLMNLVELVTYYGFPIEVHTVTSEDGYILTLHRIPGSRTKPKDPTMLPVLIVHGAFGKADSFLSNTPENCFPILLANAGMDVWLANHRGSEYSRRHAFLNCYDMKFWEFSWDEIATLDMPANIDYILKVTGHAQIYYAGHSLGSAFPFALCASKPEFNDKIKAIFALAPIGNLANTSEIAQGLAKLEGVIKFLAEYLHIYEIPKSAPWLSGFVGKFFDPLLQAFIFKLTGADYQELNSSRTEVHLAHYQSSSSMHVLIHLLQMVKGNRFRKCDWGKAINLKKYGQATPPDYDISKVTVPSYLYYGENDVLCPKNNAKFLKERLPNATMLRAGIFWNHDDFLWAKNAASVFLNDLVAFIVNFR